MVMIWVIVAGVMPLVTSVSAVEGSVAMFDMVGDSFGNGTHAVLDVAVGGRPCEARRRTSFTPNSHPIHTQFTPHSRLIHASFTPHSQLLAVGPHGNGTWLRAACHVGGGVEWVRGLASVTTAAGTGISCNELAVLINDSLTTNQLLISYLSTTN